MNDNLTPARMEAAYEGSSFHRPNCPCYFPSGRERDMREAECGRDCTHCTCGLAATPVAPIEGPMPSSAADAFSVCSHCGVKIYRNEDEDVWRHYGFGNQHCVRADPATPKATPSEITELPINLQEKHMSRRAKALAEIASMKAVPVTPVAPEVTTKQISVPCRVCNGARFVRDVQCGNCGGIGLVWAVPSAEPVAPIDEFLELVRKNRELAEINTKLQLLVDKACDAGEKCEAELAALRGDKQAEPVAEDRTASYSPEWKTWFDSMREKMWAVIQMPAGVSMGELEEWTAIAWKAGQSAAPELKGQATCPQCGNFKDDPRADSIERMLVCADSFHSEPVPSPAQPWNDAKINPENDDYYLCRTDNPLRGKKAAPFEVIRWKDPMDGWLSAHAKVLEWQPIIRNAAPPVAKAAQPEETTK